MTNAKEIIAYIIAHLAGYVASSVLAQIVIIPVMVASRLIDSTPARIGIFFIVFVVVQIAVFFLFVAIRGRRAPG